MHSLHALSHLLRGDKFCLTTVDTIFKEQEVTEYIKAFEASHYDGLMAVTDFIDDEKPLYVDTDSTLRITAFSDKRNPGNQYISGGIYGLSPRALTTLAHCIEQGEERMRNFQRALIADGFNLKAHPFGKIIDIDHADDIAKAEKFLAEE